MNLLEFWRNYMNAKEKYGISYFMPPEVTYDWVKKETITEAPIWCSVDLRDGNQALIEPMGLQEKLEYFKMLVDIGFKEIEVGFPAASDTEYQFARALIENKMIPQDVTIKIPSRIHWKRQYIFIATLQEHNLSSTGTKGHPEWWKAFA